MVILVIAFGGGFWWFYHARLKIGYRMVVTSYVHGSEVLNEETGKIDIVRGIPKILGKQEFKLGQREVNFKGKKFKVDLTKPTVQDFGWTEYTVDFKSGDNLTYGGRYQSLNPDDADEFMADGLVNRLLAGLKGGLGDITLPLIFLGIGVAVGVASGIFASPYVLPPMNQTVYSRVVLGGLFG